MQRWEYKTLKVEAKGWLGGKLDAEELTRELNALGRDGWELVSITDLNMVDGMTRQVVAVLKRPVG